MTEDIERGDPPGPGSASAAQDPSRPATAPDLPPPSAGPPQPMAAVLAGQPSPATPTASPAWPPPVPPPTSRWGPPPATPMPDEPPPGMLEVVGKGIDLDATLSRDIRAQSLYVGGLFLAALGPIAVVFIARSVQLGGFDWIDQAFQPGLRNPLGAIGLDPAGRLALVLAFGLIAAISIDVQLLVTALLGSQVAGRHLDLRGAIAWARHGFWRLVFASLAVGLMLIIPQRVATAVLRFGGPEVQPLIGTAVDLLLSMPFAYVGAAVVLAGGTPFQAIRLSWRIARRRWRLAFVVGVVNTAVSYLASFALGAAADILGRILVALGIDQSLGPVQALEVLGIVLVAIAAIGSLTLTIAALSAAPQVIAWSRLGGPLTPPIRPGAEPPWRPHRPARLVSLPMQVVLLASAGLAFIAAVDAAP